MHFLHAQRVVFSLWVSKLSDVDVTGWKRNQCRSLFGSSMLDMTLKRGKSEIGIIVNNMGFSVTEWINNILMLSKIWTNLLNIYHPPLASMCELVSTEVVFSLFLFLVYLPQNQPTCQVSIVVWIYPISHRPVIWFKICVILNGNIFQTILLGLSTCNSFTGFCWIYISGDSSLIAKAVQHRIPDSYLVSTGFTLLCESHS